jgi:hypothetical protein
MITFPLANCTEWMGSGVACRACVMMLSYTDLASSEDGAVGGLEGNDITTPGKPNNLAEG